MGGGSRRAERAAARPAPWERGEGAPRAPRPSCAPGHLVGHRVPSPPPLWKGLGPRRPCPARRRGTIATLPRPWADPGAGNEGEVPRLQLYPTPLAQPQRQPGRAPLSCRSRYPGRDNPPPRPQLRQETQISSGEGGVLRSAPACEQSRPLPLPDPGKQRLRGRGLKGGVLFCGPQGSALPQTQAV